MKEYFAYIIKVSPSGFIVQRDDLVESLYIHICITLANIFRNPALVKLST